MKVAYLFPRGVKVTAQNLGMASLVDVNYRDESLREASDDGRLRCSCEWCLAPLTCYEDSHFAHKPRKAKKNCSYNLLKDGKPVLVLPLTGEMVSLHGQAHASWHVLFLIPEPGIAAGLEMPGAVVGKAAPPASLPSQRIH